MQCGRAVINYRIKQNGDMEPVNFVQYPFGLLTGSFTDDGASLRWGRSHVPDMCSWTVQVIRQVREICDNGLTKIEDFGKSGESGEQVQCFVRAREHDFYAV